MRWGDFRQSENVEDRSGSSGGAGFGGGGIKLGGGAIVVVVIASLLLGVNPLEMLGMLQGGGPVTSQEQPAPAPGYAPTAPSQPTARSAAKDKVSRVLGDTEDVWGTVFKSMGSRYEPPKLVIFRGATQSACGRAAAAVGPFYCSADREVYLDTDFFDKLARLGAPGDFAQAYVVAHEVGHHVQNLMGIMNQFDQQLQRSDPRSRNALSMRLELQADCFAGIWGASAQRRKLLDPGDIEAGLRAAAAVGDDQIQKHTQGMVVPESFTHGSSEQRVKWFRIGLETADVRQCNTFGSRDL
jgi:predicted metalloprotease